MSSPRAKSSVSVHAGREPSCAEQWRGRRPVWAWGSKQSGQLAGLPRALLPCPASGLVFLGLGGQEPQCDCWQRRPFLRWQAWVSKDGRLWAEPALQLASPRHCLTWGPWSLLGGHAHPVLLHLCLLLDGPWQWLTGCCLSGVASLLCALSGSVYVQPPMPDRAPS